MRTGITLGFVVILLINIPILCYAFKHKIKKLSKSAKMALVLFVLGMVFCFSSGVHFCMIQNEVAPTMAIFTVAASILIMRTLTGEIFNTDKQKNEKEQ